MNDSTEQYILRRIEELEAANKGCVLDMEYAQMQVKEIERRIACNTGIIQGLNQVLEAAK